MGIIRNMIGQVLDKDTFRYTAKTIEESYSHFDGTKLIKFDKRDLGQNGYYQVPKGVTEIGSHAFYNAKNLNFVSLSEDVKIIDAYAFMNSNIMGVSMPGVEYIGEGAFLGCKNLEIVGLHSSLKAISRRAFEDCTSLNKITLPKNLKVIEEKAFAGCSNLNKVVIDCERCKTHDSAFDGAGMHDAYRNWQRTSQKSM